MKVNRKNKRSFSMRKQWKGNTPPFTNQQTPQAPRELDAVFGYGASYSFPLFWAGIIARVKKLLGHQKRSV